jgi:hypothetical protein
MATMNSISSYKESRMMEKKSFKQSMDEILQEVCNELGNDSKPKKDLPIITKNVIEILISLNHRIDEQKEQLEKTEKILNAMERELKEVKKLLLKKV